MKNVRLGEVVKSFANWPSQPRGIRCFIFGLPFMKFMTPIPKSGICANHTNHTKTIFTNKDKVSPKRKKIPRKKDFNEEALITSHPHNHLSLNASLDSQFSGVLFCRENLLNLTKAHSLQSCRPFRKHETNICNLSNTSEKAKQEKTNKRLSG